MNAPGAPFMATTHEVFNVARKLQDYNLYAGDSLLQEAVQRESGGLTLGQRFVSLCSAVIAARLQMYSAHPMESQLYLGRL
jgi:hypothetical protein